MCLDANIDAEAVLWLEVGVGKLPVLTCDTCIAGEQGSRHGLGRWRGEAAASVGIHGQLHKGVVARTHAPQRLVPRLTGKPGRAATDEVVGVANAVETAPGAQDQLLNGQLFLHEGARGIGRGLVLRDLLRTRYRIPQGIDHRIVLRLRRGLIGCVLSIRPKREDARAHVAHAEGQVGWQDRLLDRVVFSQRELVGDRRGIARIVVVFAPLAIVRAQPGLELSAEPSIDLVGVGGIHGVVGIDEIPIGTSQIARMRCVLNKE